MRTDGQQHLPEVGQTIITACGSEEKFSKNTPRAMHEGKWIYFCLPNCQGEFLQNPENSCLTSHSDSEKE